MMPNLGALYNQVAFVLLGVVTAIILLMLVLAWRNPVMLKMGLRNIPRRPAQSILIVIGLTLSTVIIVASFTTGDTLNYSVQRQFPVPPGGHALT
jgi:putative ABC transport system permease protein